MNHIEEARKVISESWGSAGNFNYAIDKAVKALDRAGLLVTDAQRSWIGRVAELEHLEARYALAFSMNTKQAAVVASMRAVVDAAVAFVKARREQQFSDQMRAGISLGETVDAWLAARNERVTDGLSRAQRGPRSECASLHARIAELERERAAAPQVECACHPGVRWPTERWGHRCAITVAEEKVAELERERDEQIVRRVTAEQDYAGLKERAIPYETEAELATQIAAITAQLAAAPTVGELDSLADSMDGYGHPSVAEWLRNKAASMRRVLPKKEPHDRERA